MTFTGEGGGGGGGGGAGGGRGTGLRAKQFTTFSVSDKKIISAYRLNLFLPRQ